MILGIASVLVALAGVVILITVDVWGGIAWLVIAFLISPYGLPMLAAWLLGQLQRLRYAVQAKIYG